jgi:hypothetical protein
VIGPSSVVIGGGGSDVWAIVAIAISVVSGGFSVYWSYHSEKRGYLDNFWFREITAPNCIEPALKLRQVWSVRIEQLANVQLPKQQYQDLIADLENDVGKAIDDAWICGLFKGKLYVNIRANYERVIDAVATNLQRHVDSPNVVPAFVAVGLSVKISELMMCILAVAAKANSSRLKIVKPSIRSDT